MIIADVLLLASPEAVVALAVQGLATTKHGRTSMSHVAHAAYLLISIGLTIWVARTLSRNGEIFLVRCFGQDEALARSTNHLLVVGFYLVNLGFISFRLDRWPDDPNDLIPAVGSRIGITLLVLGLMHFLNMAMIARFGQRVNRWMTDRENADTEASKAPTVKEQVLG